MSKKTHPIEWDAAPVHLKSGWKNNPKILSEIVTAINDEEYVEDEDQMMEMMDIVLEWMKSKYIITTKPHTP